jgi:hypothetical protein
MNLKLDLQIDTGQDRHRGSGLIGTADRLGWTAETPFVIATRATPRPNIYTITLI